MNAYLVRKYSYTPAQRRRTTMVLDGQRMGDERDWVLVGFFVTCSSSAEKRFIRPAKQDEMGLCKVSFSLHLSTDLAMNTSRRTYRGQNRPTDGNIPHSLSRRNRALRSEARQRSNALAADRRQRAMVPVVTRARVTIVASMMMTATSMSRAASMSPILAWSTQRNVNRDKVTRSCRHWKAMWVLRMAACVMT